MRLVLPQVHQQVLPASAGMILDLLPKTLLKISAPRICGDDPGASSTSNLALACSPHLRG